LNPPQAEISKFFFRQFLSSVTIKAMPKKIGTPIAIRNVKNIKAFNPCTKLKVKGSQWFYPI